MRARLTRWLQRALWPIVGCAHEWEYARTSSGIVERCQRCGEIAQVVQ